MEELLLTNLKRIISGIVVILVSISFLNKHFSHKKQFQLIEKMYGIDDLLRKLGWDNVVFPIIAISEEKYGIINESMVAGKSDLINQAKALYNFKELRYMTSPIKTIKTLEGYQNNYLLHRTAKVSASTLEMKIQKNYVNNLYADYIVDATGKKYKMERTNLEEIYGYEPHKSLKMLGFDKLVTTSEIVPLEELKERFLIMITRIKHLPTPSSRDEIRAAKTYEELYGEITV